MAKTYADIRKEIAALQKTAETVRRDEIAGVVERIKTAISTYKLSAGDLGLGGKAAAAAPKKTINARTALKTTPKAKYRDPSGKTWTGRGRRPGWFVAGLAAGKKAEDMRA